MPDNFSSPPAPAVRWWIFATILVADVLDLLSTTVTNIAAPSIVDDLHGSSSLTPWLGSSYALALGSMLVLGARLGDKFGTRRMFLIGLAGFTIGSAGCSFAGEPLGIIVARIVQGGFGALLIPQGFSILLRTFPRDQLGKVFGLFGPLMGMSAISGPVVAGVLIHLDPFGLGWRSVFLINVVLGIGLFIVAARLLPDHPGDSSVVLDPAAALVLICGLLGVLWGLVDGGSGDWQARSVGAMAVGAVLLLMFAAYQVRSADPFLTPALFRNRGFVAGLLVGSVFFAAVAGLLYVTSLYLQQGHHLGPLAAAGIMAPMSLGIIVAAFAARGVAAESGRRLVAAGLALVAAGIVGYLAVVRLAPDTLWALALPLLACGLGMGSCFGSVFAVALGDVTEEQAGSASGTLNAVQQLANAIGAALISTVYLAGADAHGSPHAVTTSLLLVLGIVLACALCLPLLPRKAAAERH